MTVARMVAILALAFLPWRSGGAAFEEAHTIAPILRAAVVRSAWIYPDRVLNSDGQDCGTLDVPATFGSYMRCRSELKEGFGTSILVSEEFISGGTHHWLRRSNFAVTFPETKLRAGKWTLPAAGLRLVFAGCAGGSVPFWGCLVSSRAWGTLEVREIGDGNATVVLDAIFIPDLPSPVLIKPDDNAGKDEGSWPAPRSVAFTVRARARPAD
jgi:hypothetical protein